MSSVIMITIVLAALCMAYCTGSVVPDPLRIRRQTSNINNCQVCIDIIYRTFCSSSYAQNYINAISKCGDKATRGYDYKVGCQRNSAGKYCGEAVLNVGSTCTSDSSCSRGCSNSLRQAGCCVNTPDDIYSQLLTACRITKPSPCSKSHITQPTVTSDPSCDSDFEFDRISFTARCDNIDPIVRALSRKDVCQSHE